MLGRLLLIVMFSMGLAFGFTNNIIYYFCGLIAAYSCGYIIGRKEYLGIS